MSWALRPAPAPAPSRWACVTISEHRKSSDGPPSKPGAGPARGEYHQIRCRPLSAQARALDGKAVAAYAGAAQQQSISEFLLNIIPNAVVDAFAKSDVLPVLLVAVLFGLALVGTLAVVPGIPVAGMALILDIDRFMSEARALVN